MSGYSSPTIGDLGTANDPGFVGAWVAAILAANAVYETVVAVNES
jgi:hypothetical protein